MSHLMKIFFPLLIFFSCNVFAQNIVNEKIIKEEINRLVKESKANNKEILTKANHSFFMKDYDSTLIYTSKFLYQKGENKVLEDYCHFFRANSFKHKKLYAEAKKEFQLIKSNAKLFSEIINLSKGEIAIEEANFKSGLHYFLKLDENKFLKYVNPSFIYGNIGVCYIHLNDYDKANVFLFKSLNEFQKQKDTISIVRTYTNIANMFYDQYKDKLAIPYFQKAYTLASKTNDYLQKSVTAENMAIVEENVKNFQKANEYLKESKKWRDLLNDQNKIWAVAESEKKFAIQQKQKEIKLLETENKLKLAQRNAYLVASIFLLLLIFIGIYFYYQKIKANKIILLQKEKLDELNATKDKLFSIISHDLRSHVNSLRNSNNVLITNVETQNYSDINNLLNRNATVVNSTYNLLDNLLNWAHQQTNQLYFQKESLHLDSIVQQVVYNFKALLYDKDLKLETNISKDIFVDMDLDSFKIILRNILDNSIKFSNKGTSIQLYTENGEMNYVCLLIKDEGKGMSDEMIRELLKPNTILTKKENKEVIGSGLGFQLCKSMLEKNGGKIAIQSKIGNGTIMKLFLPVKK